MKNIMKKIYNNVIINPYVILFFVTFLIMIPYIFSNKYIDGNDSNFHISNIFSIYTGMKQGMVSNVLPVIAHNFGYATRIFYPRLAHFSAALVTLIINGNVICGLKIIHFMVFFLSAVMMYKLVNKLFNHKLSAIISAIFYLSFPYMITETFVRDSIAESFIFIFMPMILLGLYELFHGDKKYFYLWFILGYVGLINSHLVLAVYFTAFAFIYLLLNIKKVFDKENLLALITSSTLILLLTATFTIPMLQHKSLNAYTVFKDDGMANGGSVAGSTMGFKDFFIQKPCAAYSDITYYLNLLGFGLAVYAIVINKKIFVKDEQNNFLKFLFIAIIICTFLMSKLCPWVIFPKTLLMIQFAWRLEAILLLLLSILAGSVFKTIENKKIRVTVVIIAIAFNVFTVYNAYNFDILKDRKLEDIDMSSYGMGWQREYLPINTENNLEYFDSRNDDILVKNGSATISVKENNVPTLEAEIEDCENETTIELPRIYYLGYEATLEGNGTTKKLELYMNDKGFIETKVNSNGILKLTYKGTLMMQIANAISIITLIGIVAYVIIRYVLNGKIKCLVNK